MLLSSSLVFLYLFTFFNQSVINLSFSSSLQSIHSVCKGSGDGLRFSLSFTVQGEGNRIESQGSGQVISVTDFIH